MMKRKTTFQPLSQRVYDNIHAQINRRRCTSYLWFIKVRRRELLKAGNASLSRNKGFASISFFSSMSMMFRADFVSPYLESCSFCLVI